MSKEFENASKYGTAVTDESKKRCPLTQYNFAMKATKSLIIAGLLVVFLFAGCSGDGESGDASEKMPSSTNRQSQPASNYSVKDLEADLKRLCRYVNDLEDAVDSLAEELDDAEDELGRRSSSKTFMPSRPFLNYEGGCLSMSLTR